MTAAALETHALQLPAGIKATNENDRLVVRWEGRELTLRSEATAADVEALLNFCYDAGFADASNPRLFVP